LPIVAGVILVMLVAFGLYVRSVPAREVIMDESVLNNISGGPPEEGSTVPPTDDPQLQDALRDAMQVRRRV